MNFFKKSLESFSKEISIFSEKGKQAFNQLEKKLTNKTNSSKNFQQDTIQIVDRIYWMDFPSSDKLIGIANYLNDQFGKNYFIWNVSEHKYEIFPFNEQVVEHVQPGYPSPNLKDIFIICKSIISWLKSDQKNVAIIHCQSTRGRSALVISCLLCMNKQFQHPGEALTFFCKQTKTKDVKILFPSQHLYLNYFANIQNGIKLNHKRLSIKKMVLSEVPKVLRLNQAVKQDCLFIPYIQVFKQEKIIFNSISSVKTSSYSQSDLSIIIDLGGVEVNEDVFFRCKHYQSNKLRYPVFRMMIHTGFAHQNMIRLIKADIDFTENVYVSDHFFIDIIFEEITENQETNNNQMSLKYVVEECTKNQSSNSDNKLEKSGEDEMQSILKQTIQQNLLQISASSFSIGGPEKDSGEKKRQDPYQNDEEYDFKIKKKEAREGREEQGDDDQEERETAGKDEIEKNKINRLLFGKEDKSEEDMNEDEIDDYLENLEKSDGEDEDNKTKQ